MDIPRLIPPSLLALPVLLLGCSDPAGPEAERVKGIVEWVQDGVAIAAAPAGVPTDGNVDVIQAPDEVVAGEPFTATITTVGANGCWEADGATIELDPSLAEVTPWDLNRLSPENPELVCTAALEALPREVTLRFTEPGDAVIRVLGRRVVGPDPGVWSDKVVEQTVRVIGPGS